MVGCGRVMMCFSRLCEIAMFSESWSIPLFILLVLSSYVIYIFFGKDDTTASGRHLTCGVDLVRNIDPPFSSSGR